MRKTWPIAILACTVALVLLGVLPVRGQGPEPSVAADEESPGAKPEADGGLATEQRHVAERFRELEKLLLRMAELTAPTDPRRAALLRQAVAQSKQRDIDHQFQELVELLRQQRLAVVVKNQGEVHQDLVKLLELLLSEDRSKRIESEKERVREYLKRVNKIIKEQKAVQGETARGAEERQLADRQGELADKTGQLADDLREQNSGKPRDEAADSEKKKGDEQGPGDESKKADPGKEGDQPDKSDAEGKPGKNSKDVPPPDEHGEDDQKKESQKQSQQDADKPRNADQGGNDKQNGKPEPADKPAKPGEQGGSPQEPSPAQGQPQQGEGQPGEPPQEQESNPAQNRLQQAQQRMKEAQQKLDEAKRADAADKQAEALKELEAAKAELEEILRQLREEEMARTLAMLESRFRKMLDAQVEVYEGTKRLDKVPPSERDRDDEIEAGRLSRKEAQISTEAEKALAVLREEGSAVAFPEAVTEIREDMDQVVARLAESKVGDVTQGIETDIIAALEEMIAALEKAQKDMESKSKQSQPPPTAEGEEPPLVDTLSELKMIRAMQMRVNLRTDRYARLTKTEQVDTPDLLEALKRLAEREQRIHKVTRDIVVGRNR